VQALACNANVEQLVEAAGAQQCGVQKVWPVGGTHKEDVATAATTLHERQQGQQGAVMWRRWGGGEAGRRGGRRIVANTTKDPT